MFKLSVRVLSSFNFHPPLAALTLPICSTMSAVVYRVDSSTSAAKRDQTNDSVGYGTRPTTDGRGINAAVKPRTVCSVHRPKFVQHSLMPTERPSTGYHVYTVTLGLQTASQDFPVPSVIPGRSTFILTWS